jgi:eukaryotic-like serine/threonine-protein kinase
MPAQPYDIFLNQRYELAGRVLDPISGSVTWNGQSTHIRRQELLLLAVLAAAKGEIVTRQTLIDQVWEGNDLVGESGISVAIYNLRRSLHEGNGSQPLIRTVPRKGYQILLTPSLIAEAPQIQLLSGQEIPGKLGWTLVRKLGEQAFTQTWLGADSEGVTHAFRFCLQEQHLRSLKREITMLRYLKASLAERDDCVGIIDWQLQEPPYFLELAHSAHGGLNDYAQSQGGLSKIPMTDRLRWAGEISAALAFVHDLGIVHRNISATCVLLDASENGVLHAKLGQFALGELADVASLANFAITAHGFTQSDVASEAKPMPSKLSKSVYAAPELLAGPASTASDVYALGVLLLQLAAGDTQLAPTERTIAQISPDALRLLITQALQADPTARPSAGQIAQYCQPKASPSEQPIEQSIAASAPVAEPPAVFSAVSSLPKLPTPQKNPTADTLVGRMIGPYRLFEQIGEGGMGLVFVAESRDPYRKVALKLIRSGLDGSQVLSRFEAERQALAMMNHPNVATVLDSGLAADGRPYFAMEYIAGVDIAKYCDAHHLTIQARIKLFLQVCDGVLHAHQKGVLHRDVKPNNLMVSSGPDHVGTVKVIDFGLAKSLHGKLASHTLHTHFGAFIGTPVYSSPEHVSGAATGVDTRSDIYSMGVVLYELLAGKTPIAQESLENLEPEKIRELVCKSKLPSMREKLQNSTPEQREEIAQSRKSTPVDLPKTLEGDLSWVVGKCLERDPNDRYASVLELKKDLERWLELRPVEARPTSSWYRLRKMVQRNRGLSAVIAGSVAALVMTTTFAVLGFLRAERALSRAEIATTEANTAAEFQAKQMQAVNPSIMGVELRHILQKTLQQGRAAHDAAQGTHSEAIAAWLERVNFTDVTTKQLDAFYFEPTLNAINQNFSASPLLQARLLQALGEALLKTGQYQKADEVIAAALAQRSKLLGNGDPTTLESLRTRAQIRMYLGEFKNAEADFKVALDGMRHVLGRDDPQSLQTAQKYGEFLAFTDQPLAAATLLSETVSGYRQRFGKNDRRTLESLSALSSAYFFLNRLDEAQTLGEEALAGQREILGSTHVETLSTLAILAHITRAKAQWAITERYEREVLSGISQLFGSRHSYALTAKSNLARTLSETNRLPEALALEWEGLQISREIMGANNPETLDSQTNVGSWLGKLGQRAEAEPLLRQSLTTLRADVGVQHRFTLRAITALGLFLQAGKVQADMPEALALLREALNEREASLGPKHRDTVASVQNLAALLKDMGQLQEAEGLLERRANPTDMNKK